MTALVVAFSCVTPDAVADVARFPMSDRGPLNGLLGIPDGWTRADGPPVEISWQAANNALGQQAGGETLLLDGETQTVTLRLQGRLGPQLTVGVALPWMAHGGGILDDVIDGWHDLFGLSEGIRPYLPEDDLRYVYRRQGAPTVQVEDATSGFGDLRTSAAWRLAAPAAFSAEITADAEWPTGDAGRLTGSGGTDLAGGLRVGRAPDAAARGLARFGWSAQAGLLWPGDVDAPLPPPAGRIPYYDVGVAWPGSDSLSLLVQLQGHGPAWQSDLKMLGEDALQLGLGALWRIGGAELRIGIFEDIRSDTTPDFALELALAWRPAGARASGLAPGLLHAQ